MSGHKKWADIVHKKNEPLHYGRQLDRAWIYQLIDQGYSQRAIARKFGVAQSTIWRVLQERKQ